MCFFSIVEEALVDSCVHKHFGVCVIMMREVNILFENEVNIIWNCSRECINSLRKWYLMNVCRLSYVIWVLEELVHHIPPAADVYVMYDIACTLVQHLKVEMLNIC